MAKRAAADFFCENFDCDVSVQVLGGEFATLPGSSELRPAACPLCYQFEAWDSLLAGSTRTVDPSRVRVEMGFSRDAQLIVSERVLEIFRALAGSVMEAFPIGLGAKATHWVVHPLQYYLPPEPIARGKPGVYRFPPDAPFRRHQEKCSSCNRYVDVTFNMEWVSIPPDTVFAGIPLARRNGPGRLQRVYSSALVEALKSALIPKARFSGLLNRWDAAPRFPPRRVARL